MKNGWIVDLVVSTPFLTVQILLLAFQLNNNIGWDWAALFLPIWILFFIWFVRTIILLILKKKKKDWIISLSFIITFTIFFALVSRQLDELEKNVWSWPSVFSPIWIFFAMIMLVMTFKFLKKKLKRKKFVFFLVIWSHFLVITIVLSLQIISDRWNWSLLFIPVWSLFVVFFIYLFKKLIKRRNHWIEMFIKFYSWTCILTFMILLNIVLTKTLIISSIYLFTPLLICFFGNFLCVCMFYYKERNERKRKRKAGSYSNVPPLNLDMLDVDDITKKKSNVQESIKVKSDFNVENEDKGYGTPSSSSSTDDD